MRMSADVRNRLIETIEDIFKQVRHEKKQQLQIDDKLAAYHIPRGSLNEWMIHSEMLKSLPFEELYILSDALHEVTHREEIRTDLFFSQADSRRARNYRRATDEFQYPYTIPSVLKSGEQDFLTVMSYQEIAQLWSSGALSYNFNAQRLSKKKISKKDQTVIEKPDINPKSVKNITKLMLDRKYRTDTIIMNILVDGHDQVEYADGELTIHEGTTINLIDGMHRVQAILTVIEQEPDYEGYMNVSLKHYPLEQAQFLLGQINTVNRFDKTLVKHYMAETEAANIARDLMNLPELKNRVSIKTALDKKLNYLTNFAILSDTIETVFRPRTTRERYDAADVLKKFFGYMISYYDKEFVSDVVETRKTSWMNHHNTFVGYIVLAKKLYDEYGKDFPVSQITALIDSIDFAKREGVPFNDIISPQGKVNSNKIKKEIQAYFQNIPLGAVR